jgi:pimeloyl-ACP methyl ester carboxylesterase
LAALLSSINRLDALVVLVHGMGRTRLSMTPLALALRREGYDVLNWRYSSTRHTIAEIGESLIAALRDHHSEPRRVHFVGHSLGTVVIRWAIAHGVAPERVGRVVMLAPPNQGAARADRATRWLSWLYKPLAELKTAETSTARTLMIPANVDVGVIAGRYDGKVSVAETHLVNETDHVTVPAVHSFLMFRRDVRALVLRFLQTGRFVEP